MFLKTQPLEYNGETVTLYELSALQRIEFIGYIADVNKDVPANDTEISQEVLNGIVTTINVKISARIVAMSLWQEEGLKGPSVDELHQDVLSGWPLPAISEADFIVRNLSGMLPVASAVGDEEAVEKEEQTAEKLTPQP
ncbi:phage minor tail protein G [Enterobacter hormaechei]|nr:phage minor tail protein G [Enterobacter hormaechei]AUV01619.1 phage minor tail protein G [Enterobacteriaceae bacterium ENNIH1]GJL34504.1 phage minor tail protein G [Enterobacter hormaechei]